MKKDYVTSMFEEIRDQNLAIVELTGAVLKKVNDAPTRKEFESLCADVQTIKYAVTDMNQEVKEHRQRLTQLEAKA
jgi:hypothetical protein